MVPQESLKLKGNKFLAHALCIIHIFNTLQFNTFAFERLL